MFLLNTDSKIFTFHMNLLYSPNSKILKIASSRNFLEKENFTLLIY